MTSSLIPSVALLLTLLTIVWSKDYGFGDIWQRSLNNYDNSDESYNDLIINEDFKRSDTINSEEKELSDPKSKKSPVRCTVRKMLRTHPQDGYEYHPRHYHEYECVPVQNIIDNDLSDQESCISEFSCSSVHKLSRFLKKKVGQKCWKMEMIKINAGCKCITTI